MKRSITPRERLLLLALLLMALLSGYIKLFFEPVQAKILAAQEVLAQTQALAEQQQMRLSEMQKMQKILDDIEANRKADSDFSLIPYYDNIDNVMLQLNAILSSARDYQLQFSEVELGTLLVTRPIQMSLVADDYAAAKSMISALYNCPYRCALSNITVSAGDSVGGGNVLEQQVKVSLTVAFYEKYRT